MKNQNVAANIQCTVIMPAFNEADIVGEVVKSILRSDGIAVWVIDDHSTDQTADAARLAGARVIRLPEQLGAWGAVQTGMREALRQKRHCVVTMDADGQHDPRDIIDIIKPIRNDKADVVVASCPERGSSLHKLAWSLMRLTSGLKNRDLTSGYQAVDRTPAHNNANSVHANTTTGGLATEDISCTGATTSPKEGNKTGDHRINPANSATV